jgi:hypothetical protein
MTDTGYNIRAGSAELARRIELTEYRIVTKLDEATALDFESALVAARTLVEDGAFRADVFEPGGRNVATARPAEHGTGVCTVYADVGRRR